MSTLSALFAALALMQSAPMTEAGKAVREAEAERLATCLDLAETDPEAAYEDALAWLGEGGRPPARHCAAVALIELGHLEEGAARLEDLANAPDAGSLEERAHYLTLSGNAWLAAGLPDAALTTLDNALRLRPGDAGLLKDRASARLALEQYQTAVLDLNAALDIVPNDPDALALRARAYLAQERFDAALADVNAARLSQPDNIDLLVLRGDIREARRLKRSGTAATSP